jgi:hypothetical protein
MHERKIFNEGNKISITNYYYRLVNHSIMMVAFIFMEGLISYSCFDSNILLSIVHRWMFTNVSIDSRGIYTTHIYVQQLVFLIGHVLSGHVWTSHSQMSCPMWLIIHFRKYKEATWTCPVRICPCPVWSKQTRTIRHTNSCTAIAQK